MTDPALTIHGVPVYVSGVAGHFADAERCRLRLHMRVGDYRISTLGGYVQDGDDHYSPIGSDRYAETMVFVLFPAGHARDPGTPEGEPWSWSGFITMGIAVPGTRAAERQHYRILDAVARVVAAGGGDADVCRAIEELP